jgi:hypothetical protein
MHATEALVRPKGCVTGVQNLGLPAENIWQNSKFGKSESILAQNPAVESRTARSVDASVCLGSGLTDEC